MRARYQVLGRYKAAGIGLVQETRKIQAGRYRQVCDTTEGSKVSPVDGL